MQDATRTIVVLDDDAGLRAAIRHWATRRGYAVHTASTADEARLIVAESQIDLAILDIRLPDADGINLAESLIQDDPERPVILMTAYADLDSAQRALRVGVFEFFAKPISFDTLETAVDRALAHRDRLIESRRRRTAELEEMNHDLAREVRQRREGERTLAEQTRTLTEMNEHLQQKERLLAAYQGIAKVALSSLDTEEIVDSVGHQLVEARIFKRLVIALVDEDSRRIEIVKQVRTTDRDVAPDLVTQLLGGESYDLDDANVASLVARTGEMKVVDSVSKEAAADENREVAFFVPIKTEARVIGVLGIGSPAVARDEMLNHIEVMQPMLDQVAFALDHALLYRASQTYGSVLADVNATLAKEIEERKRAEEALVRLERLGALGEMSAGVSHNLNNILTGILGPAELIAYLTEQEDVLYQAELIRTSATRARDLVSRLHESVRGENEKVGPVTLDEAVEQAIEAGRPRWKDAPESEGRRIKVKANLHSGATVAATGPGLRDLTLNILFNAADALIIGGTIAVESRIEDGVGILMISDDGVGMEESVRRRVFEPFFTTKADVGTGLGLSTVYGQVTRWGGKAEVESSKGVGTTFEVRLPLWEGEVPERDDVPASDRSGRVLVVEDEAMIRDVVARVVGMKHDVEVVSDGSSALDAFEAATFDVVILDLGIPDMPGDQIAEAIRKLDPHVSTVLMTGWSLADDDPRVTAFDLRIQKPFERMADLIDVVNRAIGIRDARAS